jgi:hypothetical protein
MLHSLWTDAVNSAAAQGERVIVVVHTVSSAWRCMCLIADTVTVELGVMSLHTVAQSIGTP